MGERFAEVGLAGAAGSADDEVFGATDPLQCHERLLGRLGNVGVSWSPTLEGLAGGKAGSLSADAYGGKITTDTLLGEEHAKALGRVPTLSARGRADLWRCFAHVGKAHATDEGSHLVGERRGLWCLHRPDTPKMRKGLKNEPPQ